MSAVALAGDRPDPYPSRRGEPPRLLPRIDPVVHDLPAGTAHPGPLDPDQVASFDRDGYVVLPDVLDGAAIDRVDDAVARLAPAVGERWPERVVREPGSDELRSLFMVHDVPDLPGGDVLAEVIGHPAIAGAARQLLGGDVTVHQTRVNAKPALRGRDFQWHSDFETWHTEDGMPRMRCLSASVWLTDNHTWNGPLLVMPGSHRTFVTCPTPTPPRNHERSLEVQEVGSPDEASLRTLHERHGTVPVTGSAGSVLLFDCNLLHASPSNVSVVDRRNVFVVYDHVGNVPEAPFSAPDRRPPHLADRRRTPVTVG